MLKMLSDVSATEVESLYLLLFKSPFSWRFGFRSLFPLYRNQKKDFYSLLSAYPTVALVMNLSKDIFESNTVGSGQNPLNKILNKILDQEH